MCLVTESAPFSPTYHSRKGLNTLKYRVRNFKLCLTAINGKYLLGLHSVFYKRHGAEYGFIYIFLKNRRRDDPLRDEVAVDF